MNTYVTGTTIRKLREERGLTQAELAERIGVSSKTVSKWETAKGLPDISLLQPLAKALGISVIELMNGERIVNRNVSANLLRSKFHVCPLCGNVLCSTGSALVSCCGITLPPLEAEEADESHAVTIENVEDEQFVTIRHPMTKEHSISFLAFVTSDRIQLVKLYPEGDAQTRLQLRGMGRLYWYCNRHGLFWKNRCHPERLKKIEDFRRESKDLRTESTANVPLVRRSFDSLCSLRMTDLGRAAKTAFCSAPVLFVLTPG